MPLVIFTPEQQKAIERGQRAEKLLQDPVFKETVDDLFAHYKQTLFETELAEREEREIIYRQHQACQDLVITLANWYAKGKILLEGLEEQEISE